MRDFSLPSARKFGIYADFPTLFWYNRSIKSRQVLLLMMTQNADKKENKCSFFVWVTWFHRITFSES